MLRRTLVAPLACIVALASCAEPLGAGPTGQIAIGVAPLQLPELTDACYSLAVSNEAGDVVWSRGGLCATRYGSPSGDLAYVGSCDASDDNGDGSADNTVTLTIESLSAASGPLDDWRDPCAAPYNPDGCQLTVPCVDNADTPVTFDLTVMRAASQGFFDVAVSFDDLFCSAKVDCEAPDGSPIQLVHDASGARVDSIVWALSCTDGDAGGTEASATHIYMDRIVFDCDGTRYELEPWLGPGNLYPGGVGAPAPFVQVMTFRGQREISNGAQTIDTLYWNVAMGLDADFFGALGGSSSCTLETRATASRGPLVDGAPPVGAIYPYIEVSVPVSSGTAVVCTQHPLDGAAPHDGVASTYVGVDGGGAAPVAFAALAYLGTDGAVTAYPVDACAACSPQASCAPTGTPVCTCLDGYFGDGATCTACSPVAHCDGGVTCTSAGDSVCDACAAGYDGPQCTDIDECALGIDDCGANATCTNTDGAFTCACDAGYSGDGYTCTLITYDVAGDGTTGSPRHWSDDTNAASCKDYRYPSSPYLYLYPGSSGSGVYTIDLGGGPFDVYCDMVNDGGGWTLVVNISNTTNSHGNTTGAYGDIRQPTGAAKLSDATINALTTVGYWRYNCGAYYNAFVLNDAVTWISQTTNPHNWRVDRGRDGTFEYAANRDGYVFSDYPSQPTNHTDYAAVSSSEGNGCYTAYSGEGWGQNGNLWAK